MWLYNPFNLRRFGKLSYAFDVFRLSRRMHNKSFTVDGLATVVGGRNVGGEYFGTGPTPLYVDLDVLAAGEVVPKFAADFDLCWASPSVHPAASIVGAAGGDPLGARLADCQGDPAFANDDAVLRTSAIVSDFAAGDLALEWTDAVPVSDDPAKGQGEVPREDLLANRLMDAVGAVRERFDGVSPYVVPGRAGVEAFGTLTSRGVSVRMLTNSLAATDVLPVHAGYAKRRRAILDDGMTLYELRRQAAPGTPDDFAIFGSSGASLHAKIFAVEGERIFVGSFNLDPRSARLNTEMGLLIDSETLAGGLRAAFDDGLRGLAWRVEEGEDGLSWVDPASGEATLDEPGSSRLRRIALTVIGWLPVEWLL